jgi:hypothetical protein
VIKDVARVEDLLSAEYAERGCVVAPPNDHLYASRALDDSPTEVRSAFMRVIYSRHPLLVAADLAGHNQGARNPITLTRQYSCRWQDYSAARSASGKIVQLRYLLLAIG